MKILIGADSRAIWPKTVDELDPGHNWVENFLFHPETEHEVYMIRAEHELPLFSLEQFHTIVNGVVPDNAYDLLILQTGWHDAGICPWPEGMLRQIHPKTFNKENLKHEVTETKEGILEKPKYIYIDRETQHELIESLAKKTKNILFIGMHSLKGRNTLTDTYNLGNRHHYDMLKMNHSFDLPGVHFLNMPMDRTWKEENKYDSGDGIHYGGQGGKFISDYIKRFIDRTGKTIQSVLNQTVNQSEFYKKALAIGSQICELTEDGDVVVLSRPTCEQLFAEFIGCIIFNRIPVILQYPSEKVEFKEFDKKMNYVKNKLSPSLCLCDKQHLSNYESYFNSFDILEPPKTIHQRTRRAHPDQTAFIQMSSGTTDDPKIMHVTNRQIIENCDEYRRTISLDKDSTVISWLPLYHDMGLVAAFLLPLLSDAKFHIVDPFDWLRDPASFLELVERHSATHIWMPNFAFKYMTDRIKTEDRKFNLSTLKKLISCSEPTYYKDLDEFYNKFKSFGLKRESLSVCYALAENVFAVTQSDGLREEVHKGEMYVSCGRSIPGVSVLIVNDFGDDVTDESEGRVYIKSKTQPKIKDYPDSSFYHGYYNTGDIGFIKEGHLYIIGRQRNSFVSYGVNVYPSPIERQVSETANVKPGRVACFGVYNSDKGTNEVHICAEFTGEDNEKADTIKKITKNVKDRFDLSATIHLKEEGYVIKTSSGKINRTATKEKLCL